MSESFQIIRVSYISYHNDSAFLKHLFFRLQVVASVLRGMRWKKYFSSRTYFFHSALNVQSTLYCLRFGWNGKGSINLAVPHCQTMPMCCTVLKWSSPCIWPAQLLGWCLRGRGLRSAQAAHTWDGESIWEQLWGERWPGVKAHWPILSSFSSSTVSRESGTKVLC